MFARFCGGRNPREEQKKVRNAFSSRAYSLAQKVAAEQKLDVALARSAAHRAAHSHFELEV